MDAAANPVDDTRLLAFARSVAVAGIVLGLVLLIAQIALDHVRDPLRFPVDSVTVEGLFQFADRDSLEQRVLEEAEKGFFNLDIDGVQEKVQKLPWVEQAYVRRIWPDVVTVTIEEHRPVARWNDDSLISENFELFKPRNLRRTPNPLLADRLKHLPVLQSPGRRHVAMLKLLKEIEIILTPLNIPLTGIREDNRRSISLLLAGDVEVVVGHKNVHERVRRFADVFSRSIAPLYDDVLRIDMRHTNGFAIAFKRGVTNNSGES